MITDKQVGLLMSLLTRRMPLMRAAAKAGISERSARKYVRVGRAPSVPRVMNRPALAADRFFPVV